MTSPLKTFRITWQLSQKELAIMPGVSHYTISREESGRQSWLENHLLTNGNKC